MKIRQVCYLLSQHCSEITRCKLLAMKRDVLRKRLWPKGQPLCSTIIMPNVEVVKNVLLEN